ncbi:TetR/AcrR family transcriptional regulator [Actinocrispum wychmicini]|uniref:TetR family transcriptional regulator n=1 Tax=Actinocrispum wychmicini TaxID=1213861 RepID=A0A4V2S8Y2_9PSEU|nr:TetR/AcrR family transcriptional regulator [Actinocrispum wychmicini]TCO65400.1 TetR family transcriptional regulator [Actinocrispum wychmicini]
MAQDRPARRRAAHLGPEKRRPLILDSALQVYLAHGYRGTSMQAVADAAGVTKPVVYECFKNRDELLLALLSREETRLFDAVIAALPKMPSFEDVEALITQGLTAFLTAAIEAPDSWRVVFESSRTSESVVAKRVRAARDTVLGRLRDLVIMYLSTLDVEDTERKAPVLAELLASICESCGRMIVVNQLPWTPDDLATYVSRLMTLGVQRA